MAFVERGETVTCIISPTLLSRGKEYSAASIQDFKMAVYNDKSWQGSHQDWLEGALVCGNDGHEVNDMAALKRHLADGCDYFFLVTQTNPQAYYRSLNIDCVVKLYHELEKVKPFGVVRNVGYWTEKRLEDLETISMANSRHLADALSCPVGHVCDLQLRIDDIIEQLETKGYFMLND